MEIMQLNVSDNTEMEVLICYNDSVYTFFPWEFCLLIMIIVNSFFSTCMRSKNCLKLVFN